MEKINSNGIRRTILDLCIQSGEGHIASSFSIVEMLIAIHTYINKKNKFKANNIILSKGHASYAYYSFLHYLNLFSDKELSQVGEIGSKFYGHVPFIKDDERFQFGSGSLGHGIPFALGKAFAKSIKNKSDQIFCILGDGEANEGTFWETLLIAEKLNLKNIKFLIDCNDSSERAIPIISTLKKMNNLFQNIQISQCNGHDIDDMVESFSTTELCQVLLCQTKKGYPVKFMIGNPMWHHRTPNPNEEKEILKYLL